jgi:hypothetical protein
VDFAVARGFSTCMKIIIITVILRLISLLLFLHFFRDTILYLFISRISQIKIDAANFKVNLFDDTCIYFLDIGLDDIIIGCQQSEEAASMKLLARCEK